MMEIDVYTQSVSEFLAALPESDTFFIDVADKMLLYRGQACDQWTLKPSLFRSLDDFSNETTYIRLMQKHYPEYFMGRSKLETLFVLQHYGVPTRLLDFSSNPLVALYFACREMPGDTGVVFCVDTPVFPGETNLPTQIIADYVFNWKNFHGAWNGILEQQIRYSIGREVFTRHAAKPNTVERVLKSNKPQFISLMDVNPRMKFQAAYAALFTGFSEDQKVPVKKTIGIKGEHKKAILKELYNFGINAGTLFSDLSNGAADMIQYVREINHEINANINMVKGI